MKVKTPWSRTTCPIQGIRREVPCENSHEVIDSYMRAAVGMRLKPTYCTNEFHVNSVGHMRSNLDYTRQQLDKYIGDYQTAEANNRSPLEVARYSQRVVSKISYIHYLLDEIQRMPSERSFQGYIVNIKNVDIETFLGSRILFQCGSVVVCYAEITSAFMLNNTLCFQGIYSELFNIKDHYEGTYVNCAKWHDKGHVTRNQRNRLKYG